MGLQSVLRMSIKVALIKLPSHGGDTSSFDFINLSKLLILSINSLCVLPYTLISEFIFPRIYSISKYLNKLSNVMLKTCQMIQKKMCLSASILSNF